VFSPLVQGIRNPRVRHIKLWLAVYSREWLACTRDEAGRPTALDASGAAQCGHALLHLLDDFNVECTAHSYQNSDFAAVGR